MRVSLGDDRVLEALPADVALEGQSVLITVDLVASVVSRVGGGRLLSLQLPAVLVVTTVVQELTRVYK